MTPLHRLQVRSGEQWVSVLVLVGVFAAWELAAWLHSGPNLFFPPPSAIARRLVELTVSGELFSNLGFTLLRVAQGVALGGSLGLVLGLLMGVSRRIRLLVDPLVAAVHPMPKIAILPLIMLIFGIGDLSRVLVAAFVSLFPMLLNTMTGVRQIPPGLFEVCRSYGVQGRKVMTRVVLPGSLPFMLTGLRLAVNFTILVTIAVEMVSAREGLGAMIWLSWQTLRVEQLYATLFVTALLGIGSNLLLQQVTAWLVPWQSLPERTGL